MDQRKSDYYCIFKLRTKWEKNIDLDKEGHRTSLRMRFDKDVDSEVRRACKEFAAFLRKEYFFPIRVVVYIKNKPRIMAMDTIMI